MDIYKYQCIMILCIPFTILYKYILCFQMPYHVREVIYTTLTLCHAPKSALRKKNWDDTKAACQSAGDRLAVFDSLESISWAKHMRKTHQGDGKHAN